MAEVCKRRAIKIIRGRAYHPQSQGSIEIANRIFKRRLQAARSDTGIKSWMKLLPIIAWVINTTATSALPKGNTPYEVWFGRKPPTDRQIYRGGKLTREQQPDEDEEVRTGEGLPDEVVQGLIIDDEEEGFVERDDQAEEEVEPVSLGEYTLYVRH